MSYLRLRVFRHQGVRFTIPPFLSTRKRWPHRASTSFDKETLDVFRVMSVLAFHPSVDWDSSSHGSWPTAGLASLLLVFQSSVSCFLSSQFLTLRWAGLNLVISQPSAGLGWSLSALRWVRFRCYVVPTWSVEDRRVSTGEVKTRTAKTRHDFHHISFRGLPHGPAFPELFFAPRRLRRARMNRPTSLWRGEGHGVVDAMR